MNVCSEDTVYVARGHRILSKCSQRTVGVTVWTEVRGYCVCVSGRPTPLSRTELSTLSSRHVATKRSGVESVRKLFPKDAAWWREEHTAALTARGS